MRSTFSGGSNYNAEFSILKDVDLPAIRPGAPEVELTKQDLIVG